MTTDTVGGIEHLAKLFSGASLRDIPQDKQLHVTAAQFITLLDNYKYYYADRWGNGTVYYDTPHDTKQGPVIAVRLYGKDANDYVVHEDYFSLDIFRKEIKND